VAVVEQEHRLVAQLGDRHGRGSRPQSMARRCGQHERVTRDDRALDVPDVGLQREQRGIERARLQAAHEVGGLLLSPHHGEPRMRAAQGGRRRGQQVRRDRRDDADLQVSTQRIARARGHFHQIGRLAQDRARPLDHLASGRGQEHAPPVALEDPHAQRALEVRELGAQRGLGDVTALGGGAEAQRVRHRHHVLELAQAEGPGRELHSQMLSP